MRTMGGFKADRRSCHHSHKLGVIIYPRGKWAKPLTDVVSPSTRRFAPNPRCVSKPLSISAAFDAVFARLRHNPATRGRVFLPFARGRPLAICELMV
jgi:hypothetical protein